MADGGVGGAIGSVLLLGADDAVTYDWFYNGKGTGSINVNADGWRELQATYKEVLDLVAAAMSESRASWSGAAGDGAQGAVSPVRAWAEQALGSAARADATVSAQSSAFTEIKGRLSPPVSVPGKPWFNDMWPGDTDYDRALQQKQANSIRNLELVRQYGDITQANSAAYPRFEEPVVVTTDVAKPPEQPVQPPPPGPGGPPPGPRPRAGGEPPKGQPGPAPGPSTVAGPGPLTGGPSGQPVNPNQFVPSGHAQAPVGSLPPVPAQDPGPGRNPVTGGPFGGLPGLPGTGSPGGSGGRVPGERTGLPGSGGPGGRPGGGAPGEPGGGGRAGGGTPGEPGAGGRASGPGGRGMPAGEVAGGRGAGAGARGGAGQPGFAPGAGRSGGDEDAEHTNKFGPVGWHEDFWEDGMPLVAPPVIGGPEEDQ